MEIITGKSGTPHISSADDGRRVAGTVGEGGYVLPLGGRLKPTLVDANTVSVASGDAIVQGRHVSLAAPETVKIANGTQGRRRIDYICMRYARDVAGARPTLIESVELAVLKGVPSTSPSPPSVPSGSILAGDAAATVPIASVELDGLTVGAPKLLLEPLLTLHELQEVEVFSSGIVYAERCGRVCRVSVRGIVSGSGSWGQAALGRLPESMRPMRLVSAPVQAQNTINSTHVFEILEDGTAYVAAKGWQVEWNTWMFAMATYVTA